MNSLYFCIPSNPSLSCLVLSPTYLLPLSAVLQPLSLRSNTLPSISPILFRPHPPFYLTSVLSPLPPLPSSLPSVLCALSTHSRHVNAAASETVTKGSTSPLLQFCKNSMTPSYILLSSLPSPFPRPSFALPSPFPFSPPSLTPLLIFSSAL